MNDSDKRVAVKGIAQTILAELDHFDKFGPKKHRRINERVDIQGRRDPQASCQKAVAQYDNELIKEAFVGYIKLSVNGRTETWFLIRRGFPMKPSNQFTKYKNTQLHSDLFSKKINESGQIILTLNREKQQFKYTIIEKNIFKSRKLNLLWDAVNNKMEIEDLYLTPKSLRQIVNTTFSDELNQEERDRLDFENGLSTGVERENLVKVELRDVPILNDSSQESVFRKSLDSRIILTGIAGCGKTTVLVKRVSAHTEFRYIREDDRKKISSMQERRLFNEHDNWIAFSPNSTVKRYLKNALEMDDVVVNDRFLKTWESFRNELINDLELFDSGSDNKIKNNISPEEILDYLSNAGLIKLSGEFDAYMFNYILRIFREAVNTFKISDKEKAVRSFLDKVAHTYKEIKIEKSYLPVLTQINRLANSFKELSDSVLNTSVGGEINSFDYDKYILDRLDKNPKLKFFIFNIVDDYDKTDFYCCKEDFYNTEITEKIIPQKKLMQMKEILAKEFKIYIMNKLSKGSNSNPGKLHFALRNVFRKRSKNKRLLNHFKPNIKTHLNKILNLKFYIDNLPKLYIDFRKEQYQNYKRLNHDKSRDINKEFSLFEVDIILFHFLRNVKFIVKNNIKLKNKLIEITKNKYRMQALIDEASDFTSIQIGAIYNITDPALNSIFVTGDLLQRTKRYGLSKWSELNYIADDFHVTELNTIYRHSYHMLELIKKLYESKFNQKAKFISAFSKFEDIAIPQKYNYVSKKDHYEWVFDQIENERKKHTDSISLAVFVNSEEQIEEAFYHLDGIKTRKCNNLSFTKCYEGLIVNNSDVSIVNIEFIKGYEFESIFILDIDNTKSKSRSLIANLLYVAITRAASNLYVTYHKSFPKQLNFIEDMFRKGVGGRYV